MDTCRECRFTVVSPVGRLTVSRVGLISDARFPGRSVVSLRDHYADIADAPSAVAELFMVDIRFASRIIRGATGSDRVDVEFSRASDPHAHAHLVPRRRDRDPAPDTGPSEDPRPHRPLAPMAESIAVGLLAAAFEVAGAGLEGA